MKKLSKIALLATFLIGSFSPAWGQTSTQGKEFWVSLIPSQSPDGTSLSSNGFKPYLAISAPKACKVTISNPNTGWSEVKNIPTDNTWAEIKDIPNTEWFGSSIPPTETVLNMGLKIEATEEVSVFCALLWDMSFDATNVLPITALQSDYIVQTYEAAAGNGKKQNGFTVLAAEDCTVDITPAAQTEGGKTTPFSVTLKAGQNYHVLSYDTKNLSGSRVTARNGKKIAVFAGAPLNRVPNDFSDRDLLYEQLFPIDYWGQNFIVSRSKQKDVNRIIITAQENATQVTIYGNYDPSAAKTADHTIQKNYSLTLNAGQSYEFEMSAGYESGRWDSKRETFTGITIVDSCAYIKTSCPCAVLSYDVGNGYYRKDAGIETYKDKKGYYGAPSMTWVSPIEQMINDIVFGVMGTNNTTKHFVNIIANTSDVQNVKLNNASLASQFKPVESNPNYSYARITLRETTPGGSNPFYHLESKFGFIATVYGNGDDESYAYTAGSSAVKRGVKVDGVIFSDEMLPDRDKKFCYDTPLTFDPSVSTDVIDKVEWDFGDGTTAVTTKEDGIAAEHTYTSPGWFDVSAIISAHRECPYGTYPDEEVNFTIRVVRPITIYHEPKKECVPEDYVGPMEETQIEEYDCDSVVITPIYYKRNTSYKYDLTAQDIAYVNGQAYTTSQLIPWTIENHEGCDSVITCNLRIVKCLDLQITNDSAHQVACFGDVYNLPFSYDRDGAPGKAYIIINKQKTELDLSNASDEGGRMVGTVALPVNRLKPGRYTATVQVEDRNCQTTAESPLLDIAVLYPSDIFALKYNNVLAVYKKGFEGNSEYEFTAYQWFHNDEAIEGATESVYHTAEAFTPEDTYYVLLTDKDGMTLPSCAITIPGPDDQGYFEPAEPAAMKALINRRLYIRKGDLIYDIYGQRVQ